VVQEWTLNLAVSPAGPLVSAVRLRSAGSAVTRMTRRLRRTARCERVLSGPALRVLSGPAYGLGACPGG
jgi:hypothetical protein